MLLKHLSTAPDFLSYLSSREGVLPSRPGLVFSEPDLFALATDTWTRGYGFNIDLPQPAQDGITYVPKGLWLEYCEGERSIRTQKLNTSSLVIDRLIDHFHTEDMSGRNYYPRQQTYSAHERALRILASESRFGRRLVSEPLFDLLNEEAVSNFWAATVPSRDVPNVRYVWLTYPPPPENVSVEQLEEVIERHLRQHLVVARATFPEKVLVGIAVPNRAAEGQMAIKSYNMTVLDGSNWTPENQEEAEYYLSLGIFEGVQRREVLHIP